MVPCKARQCGMVAGTGREGKGGARRGRLGRAGMSSVRLCGCARLPNCRTAGLAIWQAGGDGAWRGDARVCARATKKRLSPFWRPLWQGRWGVLAFFGGPGGTALGEGLGAGFPPDARRDTLEKGYTPGTMGRLLEISRCLAVPGGERLLTLGIVEERGNSNAGAAHCPLSMGANPALAGRVGVCYRHRPRMPGSVDRPEGPRSRTDAARWWPPGWNFTNISGARPRRVAIRG